MKIRPVGLELLHADRRTDMTDLTVAFRNFANAPKNGSIAVNWVWPYNRTSRMVLSVLKSYQTEHSCCLDFIHNPRRRSFVRQNAPKNGSIAVNWVWPYNRTSRMILSVLKSYQREHSCCLDLIHNPRR